MPSRALKLITNTMNWTQKQAGNQCSLWNSCVIWATLGIQELSAWLHSVQGEASRHSSRVAPCRVHYNSPTVRWPGLLIQERMQLAPNTKLHLDVKVLGPGAPCTQSQSILLGFSQSLLSPIQTLQAPWETSDNVTWVTQDVIKNKCNNKPLIIYSHTYCHNVYKSMAIFGEGLWDAESGAPLLYHKFSFFDWMIHREDS